MNSAATTNFLNTKGRRIYQGKVGGYFIMKDGKKVYKPKAAFRQVGANGNKSKVTSTSANVPGAIRRKVRSNVGVSRKGPLAAMKKGLSPLAGNLTRMLFKSPVKKAAPKKVKALGPRASMKKRLSPNAGNLTRMLFKSPVKRKVRSNKGVPRKGPVAAMKKVLSGNLTSMLFKSPVKKAAPKKVKALGPRAAMKRGLSPKSGNLTRMLFKSPMAKKVRRPVLNLIVISPGGHVTTKHSLAKKM
jgi:hypothetical protein